MRAPDAHLDSSIEILLPGYADCARISCPQARACIWKEWSNEAIESRNPRVDRCRRRDRGVQPACACRIPAGIPGGHRKILVLHVLRRAGWQPAKRGSITIRPVSIQFFTREIFELGLPSFVRLPECDFPAAGIEDLPVFADGPVPIASDVDRENDSGLGPAFFAIPDIALFELEHPEDREFERIRQPRLTRFGPHFAPQRFSFSLHKPEPVHPQRDTAGGRPFA